MTNIINIPDEISPLKKVMLHRPGNELLNLMPEYLENMLFDDIPWLEVAQSEHDTLVQTLRSLGVEVVYFAQLVTESLSHADVKMQLIEEFLMEAGVYSEYSRQMLSEFLLSMPTRQMVDFMISGLRKSQLDTTDKRHIHDYLNNDYPFIFDPMPNMYFSRDGFSFVGNGVIPSKMFTNQRARETLLAKYMLTYHKDFASCPKYYDRSRRFNIEGGDILALSSDTLAIGISQRTHANAIEQLARTLFLENSGYKRILAIDIPKKRTFMHLDTVFTMVDKNVFSVHPAAENSFTTLDVTDKDGDIDIKLRECKLQDVLKDVLKLDDIKFIKCGGQSPIDSAREQWNDGANTLAVAPGEVIVYARNTVTNALFEDNGIKTHKIPCSELSRGRGGPRCMTMPIFRQQNNK